MAGWMKKPLPENPETAFFKVNEQNKTILLLEFSCIWVKLPKIRMNTVYTHITSIL